MRIVVSCNANCGIVCVNEAHTYTMHLAACMIDEEAARIQLHVVIGQEKSEKNSRFC